MIQAVIQAAIRNRLLVLGFTALTMLWGWYSLSQTPVDAIPDLSDVQVIVKTSYPGQAPQVVEEQVTFPLSQALLSVPGATTVRGFSYFGDSYIYVIFSDDTDPYWARSRVIEALLQVRNLPSEARPALGPDASGVGWVYGYSLMDRTGQLDLSELRGLQDWFLRFELQTVPGVAEIATVGGMVKQYQVVVNPEKLQAFGVPLAHVRVAIERANLAVGASVIELAEAEYMVTADAYLKGVTDIEHIPLGVNHRGAPLLLKDVANIVIGPQARRGVAEFNGEGETVGGVVVMRSGENAREVIDAVKARLKALAPGLPDGVEIIPFYDRSHLIDRAVSHLTEKLIEEILIVTLVCFAFLLQLRASLVAVISLPCGVLIAYIAMYLMGISANIMSLGGIAIAVGTMVDGAIVMIENLHKHKAESGQLDHWQVVEKACVEVGPSLFFSLLIIAVSFMPVFALEAQEGRLFAPLVYTKTFAMIAAALLAITLVPVLLGLLMKSNPRTQLVFTNQLAVFYRSLLQRILLHPIKAALAAGLLLVSGLYPLSQIGTEFMPPLDEGDLMYMPTFHTGVSIDKAREVLQQTDKLIRTVPEVESVFGKVGRAETATDPAPLTMIETFIQLKPKSEWREGVTTETLRRELDQIVSVPGLSNAWVMPIKTRIDMLATGIKTPVGLKIAGPDLKVIQQLGAEVEEILADAPGVASVYAERTSGGRYISISMNRLAAARFNLNSADVLNVISTAVGGVNVTETIEGLERYPVNIRYPQHYRNSPEQLALLPIVAPDGQRLALGDVAEIRIVSGPAGIKSENARPQGWVYIDIADIDIGRFVAEAQQLVNQQLNLPDGYSLRWAGQFEYMQRAEQRLRLIIPVTLLVIAILLFLNFRRVADVLMIMGTLPFALIGGLWLLHWLGFNFSVAVVVGFIALVGIAAEIGVLLVLYMNQEVRQRDDQTSLESAIATGVSKRLRPILMTTIATIAGLLPIMFGDGAGSEVMQRLAAPMVGGMISALVLALLVLPVVYLLVHRASTFVASR